jgi:hypothetical protein
MDPVGSFLERERERERGAKNCNSVETKLHWLGLFATNTDAFYSSSYATSLMVPLYTEMTSQ